MVLTYIVLAYRNTPVIHKSKVTHLLHKLGMTLSLFPHKWQEEKGP